MQKAYPNGHELALVRARLFPVSKISIARSLLLAYFLTPVVAVKLLTQELAEEGYAGVEVRVTPLRTEIIISATRPQNVLGEKGQRIRELTSVVQKRCVIPSPCNVCLFLPHFSTAGHVPFSPGSLTPFFTTDFGVQSAWVDCCCGSRTQEPLPLCLRYRATKPLFW